MKVLTIDYRSQEAPELLDRSFRETGFAVIKNHPISPDLMHSVYSDWMKFFKSEQKFNYTFNPKKQEGYFPFRSENAKDYSVKDLKEFFHFYSKTSLPEGIGESTRILMDQLNEMGLELLSWLQKQIPEQIRSSLSMPLPEMAKESPATLFRILHYPPIEGEVEEGAVRAAAHEDINLITLLCSATQPGLQVQSLDQQWHDVLSDPTQIAINSGDMLKWATDHYYPSTTHRVINPQGSKLNESRFSLPLFMHPRGDVLLTPEMTAKAYLDRRLKEIGLK